MHAELAQYVLRVRQHVHQVGDRRALVAGDVADAGLQQRLGDGEDALAAEFLAFGEAQVLDLACERPLSHRAQPPIAVVARSLRRKLVEA